MAAAAAGLTLAACTPLVAPDQLALCREVLPALHDPLTAIRETRHDPVGDERLAVRIDYLVERPGRARTVHYAICHFDGRDARGRPELVDLITERGPFPGIRFVILKRWWLGQSPAPPRSEARGRSGLAEATRPG
ncbi:MAG: hypothetical protein FD152_1827 [Xanthobacteraceae bacterium]|nr:MAG: hypothetical protein FD152_1827 [Xanthobacteraceae bacterium]